MNTLKLEEGWIDLPGLKLSWPELDFKNRSIIRVSGSANAPISDFIYLLAGLQQFRRITQKPSAGKLIARNIELPTKELSKVKLNGTTIINMDDHKRSSQIGIVFNNPELALVGETALEDIKHAYSAISRNVPGNHLLDYYGFSPEKLNRPVVQLSGGELHRLICLIAIERSPKLLLVDLTRSNIDSSFQMQLRDKLCDMASNDCIVVIAGIDDHSWNSVFTAHLIVEDNGTIVCPSNVEEIESIETQSKQLAKLLEKRSNGRNKVIEVRNVCRVGVTRPMDFCISENQILRIHGENGSGKTTIGRKIVGRESGVDVAGEIIFNSPDVKPALAVQQAERSFVCSSLFNEYKNLKFWQDLGYSDQEIYSYPRSLGYGKQKLASCALALKRSTRLCVLDEPTCGMDMSLKKSFIKLLNEHKELAVLMFTHDLTLSEIGTSLTMT
jgi:ABC-type dipeptide/oligopeptide/nickel transport system ATPase subunit